MLHYLVALLLFGLGIKTPSLPPNVLGETDTTEAASLTPTPSEEIVTNTELPAGDDTKEAGKSAGPTKRPVTTIRPKTGLDGKNASKSGVLANSKAEREAFKTRLETIKDQKKKAIVEHADTKLSDLNTKLTEDLTNRLNKLSEVVTKLSSEIETVKSEGKNVSTAQADLVKAQALLATAKTAVTTQASKEYVISITTETKLKQDVGTSVKAFQTDMKATRDAVQAARKALQTVVTDIAAIKG